MSGPEIIVSAKNGRKLLLNGQMYYRRNTVKERQYWECVRKGECRGTAITTQSAHGAITVHKEGQHSHAPNQELVEAERVKQTLKRKAAEHPEATPAQILRTELPRVPSAVLSQLPDRYVPLLVIAYSALFKKRTISQIEPKFSKLLCLNI